MLRSRLLSYWITFVLVTLAVGAAAIVWGVRGAKNIRLKGEYFDSQLEVEVSTTGEITTREAINLNVKGDIIRGGICFLYPNETEGVQGKISVQNSVISLNAERKEIPLYPTDSEDGLQVCYGQRGAQLPLGLHRFSVSVRMKGRIERTDTQDLLFVTIAPIGELPLRKASVKLLFPVITSQGVTRMIPSEVIEVNASVEGGGKNEPVRISKQTTKGVSSIEIIPPVELAGDQKLQALLRWPADVYIERVGKNSGETSGEPTA